MVDSIRGGEGGVTALVSILSACHCSSSELAEEAIVTFEVGGALGNAAGSEIQPFIRSSTDAYSCGGLNLNFPSKKTRKLF